MQTALNGLTDEQAVKFRDIREKALRDGKPVVDLLLASGYPAADQAAIAEAFTPGTGKDYR